MHRRSCAIIFLMLLAWSEGTPARNPLTNDVVSKIQEHLQEQYGHHEVEYFKDMLREYEPQKDYSLSPKDEKALEDTLRDHMGAKFVQQLNSIINATDRSQDAPIMKAVVSLIKNEFKKLRSLQAKYVDPNMHHFREIQSLSKGLPIAGGTPCSTQASCKKVEMMMNRCKPAMLKSMHILAVLQAYNIFLITTHVLNTMIAVLCACVFVGPVHLCALKNFPYTCMFPYPVFQSLFMATSAVWETVKATSTLCRVYGDPGIASIMG